MLKINISDAAEEKLLKLDGANKDVILVADDGSSDFSPVGGSCSLGDKFKIVFAEKGKDGKHTLELKNNAGLNVLTSEYELIFLGEGLYLTFENNNLRLGDNSGVIDSVVTTETI